MPSHPLLLRIWKKGDIIPYQLMNELCARARMRVFGEDVLEQLDGWHILRQTRGTADITMTLARITARAGTVAPFAYSGLAVEYDNSGAFVSPTNFPAASSGLTFSGNLRNSEELGPSGLKAKMLQVDDVVLVFKLSADYFICSRSHYKGTF